MEGRDKQNLSSCSQERQTEQDREYKNGRQRWLPDGTRGCLIIWRIVRLKYEWTINPIPIHLGNTECDEIYPRDILFFIFSNERGIPEKEPEDDWPGWNIVNVQNECNSILEEKEKREKELLREIIEQAEEYKTEFYRRGKLACENNEVANWEKGKIGYSTYLSEH
ncbi:hypothetical protein RHGRI_038932 [Rhododendron griersonianum]|uniref:Uncharacterized protein n=1 Tax=Rhododendron griersonianum TaxID=479676 RepID=A0AAV6HLZ6_9ERIC|nr:hypothetical protein RHGRI_038932 [Rhododendron griersonianum]